MKHTIQSLAQEEVDRIAGEHWKEDECEPVFIVSVFLNSLMLTCKHRSFAFSERLFPEDTMIYGLNTIEELMTSLYNRTM